MAWNVVETTGLAAKLFYSFRNLISTWFTNLKPGPKILPYGAMGSNKAIGAAILAKKQSDGNLAKKNFQGGDGVEAEDIDIGNIEDIELEDLQIASDDEIKAKNSWSQ